MCSEKYSLHYVLGNYIRGVKKTDINLFSEERNMFVKRSGTAVRKFVKQIMDDLLKLNWSDHTLAEIGTNQPARPFTDAENEDM